MTNRGFLARRWVVVLLFCFALCCVAQAQSASTDIKPGEPWFDDRGQQIQAHGGGILHLGKTWFWFGEDRSKTNDPDKRYVACYSSDDLVHWKYHRQVIAMAAPEGLSGHWVLERPKVFYNAKTKKFVLYMHLDDPAYKMARVAVATSDTVDGDYNYIRSFRPLDFESRDIGQFIDDDGAAYLIFESRPSKGFYIAKLSDDYLDVAKEMSFVDAPLEGGAIVHYQGLYYALGSHLTGWKANPNVYATSATLSGPWSAMKDIAPPEVNTYDSQSSMLVKVVGSKATTVIYVGDRWKPKDLWDSRYIWMPVEIGSGNLHLPQPKYWTINAKTGVATVAR
ncbi:family 43 glycosylhydrolase [Granulicella sibirica]|uniref:Beta-glucanase n=1 Tax=Granulicella sibirica TaxID=2479048 RepID=A0A4Q0T2U5_9BACT|nr:family 43 glycosylhydrolase [Granulicella sibirica]RXH57547.1 Beta-glucanase [Granulicella sibirica]